MGSVDVALATWKSHEFCIDLKSGHPVYNIYVGYTVQKSAVVS